MSTHNHKKWNESLQLSRKNGVNKLSPFVNKCLLRAKAERKENIRKLRAGLGSGYGYRNLAAEIINEIRDEAIVSVEECIYDETELLRELSSAIENEYDMSEYVKQEEDDSIDWSQIEMSEIPEDKLLLCPFCRKSAMMLCDEHEDNLEYCCSCSKSMIIHKNNNCNRVEQLKGTLADLFERHKRACGEVQSEPSCFVNLVSQATPDSTLSFHQSNNNLHAHCPLCGFSDTIIL